MKITIDTDQKSLTVTENGSERTLDLYTPEAFEVLSHQWVKTGWAAKYPYTFTWLGRPVIQLPEDMIRIQEAIYAVKPDVIVETGVAHGGSLIFYASLCKAMGHGRIVGIDIEIRPHNRKAIEQHELTSYITLIERSSTSADTVAELRGLVREGETVLVILDSNHTREHVAEELRLYAEFVSVGSYIVATDGVMKDLYDVPRGKPEWIDDNPTTAANEFVAADSRFVQEPPAWPFNESPLSSGVTHWPGAWLRRVK